MLFLKSDREIVKILGGRLRDTRLRYNLSQGQVAVSAGISINAVQKAEKGESRLPTYVKILRVLDSLDQLNSFLPEVSMSPIEVVKMQGKLRQRASKPRKAGD